MPLEKIEITNNRAWARWRIDETEEYLGGLIIPFEKVPDTIKSPVKRLEWIAGRVLVKTIMEAMGLVFRGITKNEFGKPFPAKCHYQLALSHSYPYVAALLDEHKPVGIDVEQLKPKLLKIASRVLDKEEMIDAGDNLTKHCVYWCAKETLIKVHGKKDLIFAENLKINPFVLSKNGDILGRIIVNSSVEVVSLMYMVEEDFVMVLSM